MTPVFLRLPRLASGSSHYSSASSSSLRSVCIIFVVKIQRNEISYLQNYIPVEKQSSLEAEKLLI